nr:immunoglobulin heavy chain junction region [Mus musculus]MBK4186014.1 immunoglobulin heavy chain junction region [Mus musculus]MBK4186015.1 immunoglobulin heavy chain junction region [Mus musculus]
CARELGPGSYFDYW